MNADAAANPAKNRLSSILLNALLMALVVAAAVLATRGQASNRSTPPVHEGEPHETADMQASNYCVSCHSAGDERLQHATDWNGGIAVTQYSDCPAYKRIQEELYYTERLLLMIDRAGDSISLTPALASRLQAGQEGYQRLLDQPVTSLDAFVAEAQGLRFKLGKVYTEISQTIEQGKRTRALVVAIIISLLVALAFGWGWYNTRHVPTRGWRGRGWKGLVGRALVVLLVFAFFALPLLREPPEPVTATTPESQAMQTALDTSQRAATTADRTLGRAWMLGRVGAAWNALDPDKGQALWNEAMAAAGQAEMNQAALWGQANKAQEAAAADTATLEKAGLIASQLDAMRARSWEQSLIAEDWAAVSAGSAQASLDQALKTTEQATGIYQDLDLHKIATLTAAADPARASQLAAEITNPAIQSWAWREIAGQTGDAKGYEQAAGAARRITDPVQKSVALGRVAAQTDSPDLFAEARQAITGLDSAAASYAWVTLAKLSQDATLVEQIPADKPAERAAALLGTGQYAEAFAQPIADPYEQGRAQVQAVSGWAAGDTAQAGQAAGTIGMPLFQDRAWREVVLAGGNADMASQIRLPYLQLQALTGQGKHAEAAALAGQIKETYPLVELAVEWAKTDPQAALALVDQVTREADRAQALNAIAAQTRDPAIFDRALGMALAARVRGDALSPAQTSLDLAQAFLPIDPAKAQAAFEQAYQAALSIAIK